jgi:excisionase family DNA binding protein
VKDVAARLQVSTATIYGLLASGKLRHYRIGNGRGVMRISEEHLAEYLRGAEPRPKQPIAPSPLPRLKHLHLS